MSSKMATEGIGMVYECTMLKHFDEQLAFLRIVNLS